MAKKVRAPCPSSGKGPKKLEPRHIRSSRTSLRRKKGDANNEANNEPDEQLFSVEKIVDCKIDRNGVPTYKTRWSGYSANEDTWEPYENVVSTGHVDWYERKQRQHTLKENFIGVAVIEYEDGEFEMVDLRTEKFRSYRSEDEDGSISDEDREHESADENNFGLVGEGEWIEIFWKHAKIYFPCKIISWTPLRATRRTALKSPGTITTLPSTTRASRGGSSLLRVPDKVDVKGSSTRATRRSSQTSKQEATNSPEKLTGRIGMAKNEEPPGGQLPAKKPTKLEPDKTGQRGYRVGNQLDAVIRISGESEQRIDYTESPPIVGQVVFEPKKQLKRQGEKQSASYSVAVGAVAKKRSKLEEVPHQPLRTEADHNTKMTVPPQSRVPRERNKGKKSQATSFLSPIAPANNSSMIISSTTMIVAEEAEVKSRSHESVVPGDQPGKEVVAPPRQHHHKLRRGNLLNQSAGVLITAGLLEPEASEQDCTSNVLRDSGGLQYKDDAQNDARHNCSSHDSSADDSSSALLYHDREDEEIESSNEGILLYDEPEDDFDSSSSSYSDDDDDEHDSDEDRHIHHFEGEDDDGSDDDEVHNNGKGIFAYQVEGPKLTFEEQWMLKLKQTQELTFR